MSSLAPLLEALEGEGYYVRTVTSARTGNKAAVLINSLRYVSIEIVDGKPVALLRDRMTPASAGNVALDLSQPKVEAAKLIAYLRGQCD